MSEGFLGRWSRLKQAPEKEAETIEMPEVLPEEVVKSEELLAQSEPSVELAEPEVLTDIDMPDLTTINATSDMSMFFSTGVSAELRRQALRKFFHQPEFNVRDPLDDYALDYSNPDKLVLKVGDTVRGWAKQQMDDAMQQARDALLQPESGVATELPEPVPAEPADVDATSDATKVDEADRLGINDSVETK